MVLLLRRNIFASGLGVFVHFGQFLSKLGIPSIRKMGQNQRMNRVREWRHRRELSIEELARRSRTTPSQISKLERGQRRLTVEWLGRLAKALGCRSEDLLPPEPQGRAAGGAGQVLDRELLRRMGRALMRYLKEERLELSPPRFLETAIALHDLIATRPPSKTREELPAELKSVIRLISAD
jgi:transcriptional regulator with XRE-family HTH domain